MTRSMAVGVFVICSLIALAQNSNTDLLNAGQKLADTGKYDEAFKLFEKASKAGGKPCSNCFYRMSLMKYRLNDENGTKKFANKAIETAQTPQERADAYAMKGEALLGFAENGNKKELAQAELAYREALKQAPTQAVLHARLGVCLVREGDLDGAKQQFQEFLNLAPNSSDAALVKVWLANPARALYPAAPNFEFTTSKGETISLSELTGKTVVLDFWGTWCPPCRASVPEIKELTRKYPADKLVVISISSDTDESAWSKFIADKKMDWVQYRDADHKMRTAYHVEYFPTYIVIDQNGNVRDRFSGLDPRETLQSRIEDTLKKIL